MRLNDPFWYLLFDPDVLADIDKTTRRFVMEMQATLMSHNIVSGTGKASGKPYTFCLLNILFSNSRGELRAGEKAVFMKSSPDEFSGLSNGSKYLFNLEAKADKNGRLDFDIVSFKKA